MAQQGVPNVNSPIVGSNGQLTQPWYQYLITLFTRTVTTLSLPMIGKPGNGAKTGAGIVDACTFPANFAGSVGTALTASTGTAVVKINQISAGVTTQIGTATYTTSATPVFATTGGVQMAVSVGDIVEVVYPNSADATLADIFMTLRAARN